MRNLVISQKFNGKKLTAYLASEFPKLSQNTIYKALRKKDIRVNDVKVSENVTVYEGDNVKIYIVGSGLKRTEEFTANFNIIQKLTNDIIFIKEQKDIKSEIFELIKDEDIILDCIFGVGLNRTINDFRYEESGACKGLERVRAMTQNDSHIFCTPEQVEEEFKNVVNLIMEVYKDFNIDVNKFEFRLSLRDKNSKTNKYYDDDEMWDKAENALRKVLTDMNLDFFEAKDEAAFYGPKLDVLVKPAVGPAVTIPTVQLDFLLPKNFELSYIDESGEKKTPVVIHRAILGSIDRFMAFLLEETKGAFPLWIAPVQVKILPVSNEFHLDYAKEVLNKLLKDGIKAELDDRDEKVGYRMREAVVKKIPIVLVLGQKEVDSNTISYRLRGKEETITVSYDDFILMVRNSIKEHL